MRAVILKFYHMPNGLTSKIHNKIPQNFSMMLGCWGRWKNDPWKILHKKIEKRLRKLKKSYSQDLVEQTVGILYLFYTYIDKVTHERHTCKVRLQLRSKYSTPDQSKSGSAGHMTRLANHSRHSAVI